MKIQADALLVATADQLAARARDVANELWEKYGQRSMHAAYRISQIYAVENAPWFWELAQKWAGDRGDGALAYNCAIAAESAFRLEVAAVLHHGEEPVPHIITENFITQVVDWANRMDEEGR